MVHASHSPLTFEPIGVIHSPFMDKKDAPRQSAVSDARGTIELFAGHHFEDAVSDLEVWSHLWVVFIFDRAGGYRPKVQPPRSATKKGVLATRSPHRPNPIGLSAVRLERVRGLCLDVSGVDMLDQSPVLDIKPYVSYTDSIADASKGWLDQDPVVAHEVVFSEDAKADLKALLAFDIDLEPTITRTLALGPEPHAYRRIKKGQNGAPSVLAIKDWRVKFCSSERGRIFVIGLFSGYSAKSLASQRIENRDAHIAISQSRIPL